MQLAIGNPGVGDSMKEFELARETGQQVRLDEYVGKSLALVFCPSEQVQQCQGELLALKDAAAEFQSRGLNILAVLVSPVEALKAFGEQHRIPYPLLSDSNLQISAMYGALRPKDDQPQQAEKLSLGAMRRTLLVGPHMRIAKIYDNPEPTAHPKQLLKDFDELIVREPPRRMVNHAPVLLIPNVLPPELCQRLIQVWQEQGNDDSGFMKQIDGKTVGIYDYAHKIRRDHFMKDSPELTQLKKYLSTRVIPAIVQAFDFDVTRFEDIRIACYDAARGGYFRPHRDNTTDGTSHRRFAMSLLLNNDYGGGSLRFPEFGLHEYRPNAGDAVVFSCSLLHEATDVTSGQRFVLLTFFYGEKEAKRREEYNKRTGGMYRA